MKTTRYIKMTAWALALMLVTACSSGRGLLGRHSGGSTKDKTTARVSRGAKKQNQQEEVQPTNDNKVYLIDSLDKAGLLQQVNDNAQEGRFITSKLKFTLEINNQQMQLTGNLKMKRDDVIRLQLMAFGFVEAGRLEFTPEYVLIVDRINKQYLKMPYEQLEFLNNTNIDFYTLQALFWNELHQPGLSKDSKRQARKLQAEYSVDHDIVLSIDDGKLAYRWLAEEDNGRIKMTNILYSDYYRGKYQLNWDYRDFKPNDRKFFPTKQIVTVTTPDKVVKLEMKLTKIDNDERWDTRTVLSGKYQQMPIDEILRRFMSL